MKVKFLETRVVDSGLDIQEFKEGEVYDLSEPSAARWIRRGVAVEVIKTKRKKKRA